MTPLGLIQAISEHTRPLDVPGGLAVIKLRLLRALQDLGAPARDPTCPAALSDRRPGIGLLPPPGSGCPGLLVDR